MATEKSALADLEKMSYEEIDKLFLIENIDRAAELQKQLLPSKINLAEYSDKELYFETKAALLGTYRSWDVYGETPVVDGSQGNPVVTGQETNGGKNADYQQAEIYAEAFKKKYGNSQSTGVNNLARSVDEVIYKPLVAQFYRAIEKCYDETTNEEKKSELLTLGKTIDPHDPQNRGITYQEKFKNFESKWSQAKVELLKNADGPILTLIKNVVHTLTKGLFRKTHHQDAAKEIDTALRAAPKPSPMKR